MYNVQIYKMTGNDDLPLPVKMSPGASGYDLHAAVPQETYILPGKWQLIPTGICLSMPIGLEAQIRPRSGLALKQGITLLNTPGTIDADYRGEIGVIMLNLGDNDFKIIRGDRIAQMIFIEVAQVDLQQSSELAETLRGSGGFGHTGR